MSSPMISTYNSDDVNSGFSKSMEYKSTSGDKAITLVEMASKETHFKEKTQPCMNPSKGREINYINYIKEYNLNYEGESSGEKIKLKCFEFTVSTCG